MKRQDKKAAVGETVTFIAVMFIIAFALMLFIAIVFMMVEQKIDSFKEDIKYESGNNLVDRISINQLIALLNSEIKFKNQDLKVKDVFQKFEYNNFEESDKQIIKEEIIKVLKNLKLREGDCYLLRIYNGFNFEKLANELSNNNGGINQNEIKNSIEIDSNMYESIFASGYDINKYFSKAIDFVLVKETSINLEGVSEENKQKVYIKFYYGAC